MGNLDIRASYWCLERVFVYRGVFMIAKPEMEEITRPEPSYADRIAESRKKLREAVETVKPRRRSVTAAELLWDETWDEDL